ncbi:hypothetical protein KBP53_09225 [Corynebacterium genitalium ATCC 33030]|uniref:Uncharacterized protein n=1 Tax=Corynebacterium genitalium ATCC 33030 TaxID=585529 RepID=D7WBX0_9CORY|nr:hypothetical protein [Corynebacterium genitalium]EFK54599.1 hypothetical protein HMPREF0291_10979 [Corynebacterium genitalium ATCC 33030]UUA89068.1 hypothetical protein KBP53_09225 [Corynebacterium genitalium ATCC 33030]
MTRSSNDRTTSATSPDAPLYEDDHHTRAPDEEGRCGDQPESAEPDYPPASALEGIVAPAAYRAFTAGWSAGVLRRTTQPASAEVIDDIATMLDAVHVADALTEQE